MIDNSHTDHGSFIGTVSGTILSISSLPPTSDVIKTIILGVVGAISGYLATYVFKQMIKWYKSYKARD